jgi:hypothetical protein
MVQQLRPQRIFKFWRAGAFWIQARLMGRTTNPLSWKVFLIKNSKHQRTTTTKPQALTKHKPLFLDLTKKLQKQNKNLQSRQKKAHYYCTSCFLLCGPILVIKNLSLILKMSRMSRYWCLICDFIYMISKKFQEYSFFFCHT